MLHSRTTPRLFLAFSIDSFSNAATSNARRPKRRNFAISQPSYSYPHFRRNITRYSILNHTRISLSCCLLSSITLFNSRVSSSIDWNHPIDLQTSAIITPEHSRLPPWLQARTLLTGRTRTLHCGRQEEPPPRELTEMNCTIVKAAALDRTNHLQS
jgi:hypothetical protein